MTVELGTLEHVDPRIVWPHEAHDFTPWLLASGDRLAEALGIDLELEAAEHAVGGYSLDLVGRDLTNDATLIVENQLAGTDHSHLGQLLTYAAGTDASTIVWIATSFREEHRQAIDWLNEVTGEATRFFGLELQLVRIGESLHAPLFKVASQPNDWQKHVRAATQAHAAGGKGALYVQFWEKLLERIAAEHSDWTRSSHRGPHNWITLKSPISGTGINSSFALNSRLRHELYIDTGDGEENDSIFGRLSARKAEIEASYGRALSWEELPAKRACRVADYKDGCDVTQTDDWDDQIAWLIDAGIRLRRSLALVSEP